MATMTCVKKISLNGERVFLSDLEPNHQSIACSMHMSQRFCRLDRIGQATQTADQTDDQQRMLRTVQYHLTLASYTIVVLKFEFYHEIHAQPTQEVVQTGASLVSKQRK
jgi:hypothetical protein